MKVWPITWYLIAADVVKFTTAISDLPSVGTSCSPWQLLHPLHTVQNWVCLVPCRRCPGGVQKASMYPKWFLKFATEELAAGTDFRPDNGTAADMCLRSEGNSSFVIDRLRHGTRDNGTEFVGVNMSPKANHDSASSDFHRALCTWGSVHLQPMWRNVQT
jgi:hypothetical protein